MLGEPGENVLQAQSKETGFQNFINTCIPHFWLRDLGSQWDHLSLIAYQHIFALTQLYTSYIKFPITRLLLFITYQYSHNLLFKLRLTKIIKYFYMHIVERLDMVQLAYNWASPPSLVGVMCIIRPTNQLCVPLRCPHTICKLCQPCPFCLHSTSYYFVRFPLLHFTCRTCTVAAQISATSCYEMRQWSFCEVNELLMF